MNSYVGAPFTPSLTPLVCASILAIALAGRTTSASAAPGPQNISEVPQAGEQLPQSPARPANEATRGPESSTDVVQATPAGDLEELRRRIDVLAAEVEQLRSGEQETALTDAETRALGLAPSAAAAYRKQGASIAGYGEMLFERFADLNQRGEDVSRSPQLDFLRAILYAGYRFNDRAVFNSEIEFEHADELSVEFAYLDYVLNKHLTLRGGMLLLPLGLLNEYHEPNVFLGARRPETERRIIPSTWKENGFGALGSAGRFAYRAYLISGLDASGFTIDGLREGRQEGSRSKAEDLAIAGRLDITPTPGAFFGVGLFSGGAGQGQFTANGRTLDVRTVIAEAHGQAQIRGADVRALYARASIDNAAALNAVRALPSTRAIARMMQGGYMQVGYDVLSQQTDVLALTPYYRFERVNTQSQMPQGYLADSSRDGTFHTLGLEFRPIHNIAIKTDYQWMRDEMRSGRNQLNISLGYAF